MTLKLASQLEAFGLFRLDGVAGPATVSQFLVKTGYNKLAVNYQ